MTRRFGQIFRFGSRWFRVDLSWSWIYHRSQKLAGFSEIWLKSDQICWDLAGSVEIGHKSRFFQITARSRRILLEIHNTSLERIKDSIRVKCHGFWNEKPTTDLRGVGLSSSEPSSDSRSRQIEWRRVGHGWVCRVERVAESSGQPYCWHRRFSVTACCWWPGLG